MKTAELLTEYLQYLSSLDLDSKVDAINEARVLIHQASPFNTEPTDLVLWVKNQDVHANDYNPNSVAPPEMRLLELSILEDGYTQPIVTMKAEGNREVIDGFHRNRVGKESFEVSTRVHGYLPVVTINQDRTDKTNRMAATIRHNRARGKHKVDSMSDIVMYLKKKNWSDEKIGKELGMEADEVLRLAQITGLAEMFKDKDFTQAWEAEKFNDNEITLD
jgi:ParB-like chromosome segregation protein Spo0J